MGSHVKVNRSEKFVKRQFNCRLPLNILCINKIERYIYADRLHHYLVNIFLDRFSVKRINLPNFCDAPGIPYFLKRIAFVDFSSTFTLLIIQGHVYLLLRGIAFDQRGNHLRLLIHHIMPAVVDGLDGDVPAPVRPQVFG